MDAERFPITTPYGQVPGYELNNGWHRGEDRAMPMDTPVLVNGHEIGLSGNSGQVTGPHLHIGRFVGGHDTAPNGGGFHFASAVVTEVGEDPVNGKFVRVQADGASWVYLHLSRQTVPVGQGLIPIIQAPVPTGPPYSITQVDPYKRDVLAGHQKWNLDQPNFESVRDNPILTLNQQTTITVAAELHHHAIPQYTYLLEDPNVPQGYNQLDTVAYVVPAPVYVPPAAPVEVRLAPKVTLLTDVVTYQSASNAQTGYKPSETKLPAGEYYQISTDFGMWNLSTDNMRDLQVWVNPRNNVLPAANPPQPTPVPPVEPEPTTGTEANQSWKQYYRPYPVKELYLALHDYVVADIGGSRPSIHLPKYDPAISQTEGRAYVYGTFPGPDGIRYYRLKHPQDLTFSAFYGVPILDHDGLPILIKQPAIKKATAAPVKQKANNKDTIHLVTAYMEEGVTKFMDMLPPKWYKQINKQKGNK